MTINCHKGECILSIEVNFFIRLLCIAILFPILIKNNSIQFIYQDLVAELLFKISWKD